MDPRGMLAKRRNMVILAIGPVLFIVFLYFYIGSVGMGEIVSSLQRANPWILLLAFPVTVLNTFFFSLSWQRLLEALSTGISLKRTFRYTWISLFVDILIPAESVAGELSRIYLLSKDKTGNAGANVSSVLTHRIINTAVMLFGFIIGMGLFLQDRPLEPHFLVGVSSLIVVTSVLLALLILPVLKQDATQRMVMWLLRVTGRLSRGRWSQENMSAKIDEALGNFKRGNEIIRRNGRALLESVGASILAWLAHVLVSQMIFFSLGHIVPLSVLILVLSISSVMETFPFLFSGVGIAEIIATGAYALLSVPAEIGAAATILIRLVTVWFRFLVGYLVLHWNNTKRQNHC